MAKTAHKQSSAHGPLNSAELKFINAWWRACNYLSVGMIYLRDNPLLKEPLKIEHQSFAHQQPQKEFNHG